MKYQLRMLDSGLAPLSSLQSGRILWSARALCILLALSGCVTTGSDVRKSPNKKIEFVVKKNFKGIYETVVVQSRNCIHMDTAAHIIEDKGLGTVTYKAELDTFLVADITAKSDVRTLVEIYYIDGSWTELAAKKIEAWAADNVQDCSAPLRGWKSKANRIR